MKNEGRDKSGQRIGYGRVRLTVDQDGERFAVRVYDGTEFVRVASTDHAQQADAMIKVMQAAIEDAVLCDRGVGHTGPHARKCLLACDGVYFVEGIEVRGLLRELMVTGTEALKVIGGGGTCGAATRFRHMVECYVILESVVSGGVRKGQGIGDRKRPVRRRTHDARTSDESARTNARTDPGPDAPAAL